MTTLANSWMEAELEAYKKFRNERLVPDYNHWLGIKEREEQLLFEYDKLLLKLHEPIPTIISLDLGAGYEADLERLDSDHLLVSVGFGFFCEMSEEEAGAFIPQKQEQLKRLLGRRELKLQSIKRHLDTTDRVIKELESLQ